MIVVAPIVEECLAFIARLNEEFQTKLLDGSIFLGLQITQGDRHITLTQTRYVGEMLERFNMAEAKPVSSPLVETNSLTSND